MTPNVEAPGMERLIRELLDLLGRVTGLESTYFTRVDWDNELQRIVWARNTAELEIPEGLSVPWAETICRRALAGEPSYTTDVPGVYGDVEAAEALGLQTYLMVPVAAPSGDVVGTVCAVSRAVVEVPEDARLVMEKLSEMITLHLAAEAATHELQEANRRLEDLALLDPLTALGNRRALDLELQRVCGQAARRGEAVGVLAVDVDHFKAINDTHGHGAGDAVLRMVADQLRRHARVGDTIARPGGDEFVLLLPGASTEAVGLVGERVRRAVAAAVVELDGHGTVRAMVSIGGASSQPSIPSIVLEQADRALYLAKGRGRNCVATVSDDTVSI